jgi:type II secretory pathway component PulF
LNPIEKTYRYLVDWMNTKGEMVQNTIAATSMQDAMTELQEIEGMPFSINGSGKPRFVNIRQIDQEFRED